MGHAVAEREECEFRVADSEIQVARHRFDYHCFLAATVLLLFNAC
jgi:hypothetical protein